MEEEKVTKENFALLLTPLLIYITTILLIVFEVVSPELYQFYPFALIFGLISTFYTSKS